MDPMLISDLVLATLGAVSAVIAFRLLRVPLRDLMNRTVGIDAATSFYERILLLCLLYVVAAAVFSASLGVEKSPNFMSYVWMVGDNLGDVLAWVAGVLALYLVIVTIIIATHHRRD